MDAACVTYEAISFEQDVFPKTKEPIWILGKQYITDRGKGDFIRQNEVVKHLTMPEYFQSTAARKILLGFLCLLSMYQGNNLLSVFILLLKCW